MCGGDERLAAAGADAPEDPIFDELGCVGIADAGGADEGGDVVDAVVADGDFVDDGLEGEHFIAAEDGRGCDGVAGGGHAVDFAFLVFRGITDEHLHEEAVQLGFGKGVGAFLFDGVLRGEYEEGVGERVAIAADGDLAFGHAFEECGLGLGGRAVDFIREDDVGEEGAVEEFECSFAGAAVFVHHVRAGDVAGHEVGGELDTIEAEAETLGKSADHERLGEARDAFEDAMPAGEEADEELVDDFFLADDGAGHLEADGVAGGF